MTYPEEQRGSYWPLVLDLKGIKIFKLQATKLSLPVLWQWWPSRILGFPEFLPLGEGGEVGDAGIPTHELWIVMAICHLPFAISVSIFKKQSQKRAICIQVLLMGFSAVSKEGHDRTKQTLVWPSRTFLMFLGAFGQNLESPVCSNKYNKQILPSLHSQQ